MTKVIDTRYDFGDLVYLKTDKEQLPRMVTAFILCPAGDILYELTQGATASKHYEFEITAEKNVVYEL